MSRLSEQTIMVSPESSALLSSGVTDPVGLPRFDGGPTTLADLMIGALLAQGDGHVSLDPDHERSFLALRRGNATVAQVAVPAEVAAATIGRLARAAGLDPLVERGALTQPTTARIAVRLAGTVGEVLVTTGATSLGLSVELRLLAVDGQAVGHRPHAQLRRCATCHAYQPASRRRCEHDGGTLRDVEDDPRPGGTIGVYRVISLLGEGGMGRVFAGEHALIERRVAIKVLRARLAAENAAFESHFLFEARAASRLRHPSIVEVNDYGVLASGLPFIVMEWLDGQSLEHQLAGRAIEPVAALRIARAIASGLGAAHEGGVIHNDLKPSNVILLGDEDAEEPRLKIIDFGAASTAGVGDPELIGTASYMAPERTRGEQSDARSDGYSLGVMLYQMLAGAHPFVAADALGMMRAHRDRTPPPVTSPVGALPRRVVHLVMRALEKKPSERHQSMTQLIGEIDQAIAALTAPAWRKWLP
jgi:tRNA A-37 threonylcarbamoyl transferase component Bud32